MKSFAITFTILLLGASPLAATPVTMYLEGGRSLNVDFERANEEGVTWRLNSSDPNPQVTPLSQISHIDFPPPATWEEAEEFLATGDLDAALEKFAAIAKNQFAYGYPVPGNYSSKALLKLLAIQRRKLDAIAIADQARILKREAATLTPEERQIDPVIESWIALSKEEYETALKSLEEIENGNSEVAYLRGRALEGSGEVESAVESYAETYTLGIGDRSEMSRDALRRSITILDALENKARFLEVHAQLKLYAELYGAGKLWPGAPEHLLKTAAEDLNTITGMVDKPIVAEPDPEPEPEPAPEPPAVPAKAATVADAPSQPPAAPAEPPKPYVPPQLTYDLRQLDRDFPPDERDWLLPQQLEQRIYFIDQPPFENRGAIETQTGWAFDGESSVMEFEPFVFRNIPLRIRLFFTPSSANGILLHAGVKNEGRFGLYIVDEELRFLWRPENRRAKTLTMKLGKVLLNQPNTLGIQVQSQKAIKGWFNGQPMTPPENFSGLIGSGAKLDVRIAGNVGKLLVEKQLPNFKGEIHFFSLGAQAPFNKINQAELAIHGGKKVRFGPPELAPLVP